MKKQTIKTALGSLAIAGALLMAPSVFADTVATTTGSFNVNSSGVVRVKNAEVTSVSGNVVNAITRFTNFITNWTFTTNASTTIAANNSISTSTSNIRVGDRINVAGTLSALGSTISVNASKIVDITSYALFKTKSGTVQSVNTTNGTFVLKTDDKLITVQTNASTTFSVIPTGTTTATTTTLAGLTLNSKVQVVGSLNADKTVLTATKVLVKPVKLENENRENNKNKRENKKENRGASQGLKNGWKAKEDRDNEGEHKGFLKTNIGAKVDLDL